MSPVNSERAACAAALEELAQWAVGVELGQIPPEVRRKAARVLADDMGALIGARGEPEVVAYHSRVLARHRPGEATLWRGGAERTDRVGAAVANAVAADWLELDEGYRVTPCHAGLYLVPALLAHAESTGLAWKEFLRALVIGYEVVTRVARSWTPRALNMQSHGRYSAIGAAAAVGIASRLSSPMLVDAISAAATLIGPAPRNHLVEGALVRNVWPASGAWSGMMAVEWAECGIAGTPGALFDVYSTVLLGTAHPECLTQGLGSQWAVMDGYTKIYACCQHLHSAVEAAVDLRTRHPTLADASAIVSVNVETHELAVPLVNPEPHTTLAAKFSMPHAVAAALIEGEAGAASFDARSLTDPAIAALRGRINTQQWTGDLQPPNDRPARVTVHLRDGGLLSADCLSAQGGPDRPLPEDTWRRKMIALAQPAYPAIVGVFDELVTADGPRLDQPWPAIVADICAGAPA